LLYKKGYKYVVGKSATHFGTFKLYVNFQDYCDISFLPKNIYHCFKYNTVNGFKYIDMNYVILDKYRMFCDPMLSFWRLEKELKRLNLINKYYPYVFPDESKYSNNILSVTKYYLLLYSTFFEKNVIKNNQIINENNNNHNNDT
jgi:hypothetical protein